MWWGRRAMQRKLEILGFCMMSIDWHHMSIDCMPIFLEILTMSIDYMHIFLWKKLNDNRLSCWINQLHWVLSVFLRSHWANVVDVNRLTPHANQLMLSYFWIFLKLNHVLFPDDFGRNFGFISPNGVSFKTLES